MRSKRRENPIEAPEVRFSAQEWVGVVGTQLLLSTAALAILGGTYAVLNTSSLKPETNGAGSPLLALAHSPEMEVASPRPVQRVQGVRQAVRKPVGAPKARPAVPKLASRAGKHPGSLWVRVAGKLPFLTDGKSVRVIYSVSTPGGRRSAVGPALGVRLCPAKPECQGVQVIRVFKLAPAPRPADHTEIGFQAAPGESEVAATAEATAPLAIAPTDVEPQAGPPAATVGVTLQP
jgi:hypothetical protein